MIKAGFISLGCAKNLVDTEVMLGILASSGVMITNEPEKADILIINTCGFIDTAKEESILTILQMAEYKKADCKGIIVAGCLGQRYRQELLEELPEIDVIIGTDQWHRIMEAVEAVYKGERKIIIDDTTTIYNEMTPRIITTPFYSAYVKIAEGCSNYCSYCAIPSIRGGFRSRTIESIVTETKQLVEKGVKEINLIAQDTTSYGRDLYGKPKLVELLSQLVKIKDLQWIRLLYCYPRYFSDELISIIAQEPKICKYIDLPLQHADDNVLTAMNRHDGREDIETLLKKIKTNIPGVALRSSFIVGFPGETEEQFENLRQFVSEQKFDHVGVFVYSPEEGTAASLLPNQISEDIKQERYHSLMEIQSKISEELNCSMEGKTVDVIVEGSDESGIIYGRSYREAPDVDGRIFVENAQGVKVGDLITVKITQGYTYDLLGEKLSK